jgi:hypothetical protein
MASPAIPMAATRMLPAEPAESPVLSLMFGHASVLAPPDVAPPKSLVS